MGGTGSEAERAAATAREAAEAADQAAEAAARHHAGAADARADASEARGDAADARDGADAAREGADAARVEAERAKDAAVEVARGLSDLPEGDPVVDPDVRAEEAGVDAENPFGRPGRPMNRRSPFRIGFSGAIGVGLAYLLYQAVVSARSVLVLVVVAAFLAIGLNPTVTRLQRTGMRRGAAVGIVFLAVIAFFVAVGFAVVPPVVTQVANFIEALPGYVRDLQANPTINDLDQRFKLVDRLNEYVTSDLGGQVAGNVVGIGQQVASIILKSLTILILTLYFLSSFNTIKTTAYRLVPRSRRARVSLIGDEILSRVGGYVAGAFVIALIAGTATLIWVSALGIQYPLALALIVTVTDIIPLIGATIGAVIVTAVSFFHGITTGIATGVFFLVYQQIENYLIYPRVMSRSVDVNPAAAIVGALIGGTLLGFVGALLAVPATAAIQLILREVLVPRQDAQ
ncbi:MAG TPA: AI-2E family transporter [Mycobacteriales bacterium]|nr:AI-2E family transporter [Mycobacteriales bacterium]